MNYQPERQSTWTGSENKRRQAGAGNPYSLYRESDEIELWFIAAGTRCEVRDLKNLWKNYVIRQDCWFDVPGRKANGNIIFIAKGFALRVKEQYVSKQLRDPLTIPADRLF